MSIEERFLALFSGNTKAHGQYPAKGKPQTKHAAATVQQAVDHLEGKMGLGMVPINEEAVTTWGAIDIDCHGEAEAIDTYAFADKVQSSALPLLTCRSKSGGIHLYLFLKEPMPARNLRHCLKICATLFGHPKAEIFPKQDKLDAGSFGNWINLPYFDAENKTNRYCVYEGAPLSLEQFVTVAESKAVKPAEILSLIDDSFNGAPPCICHMLENGVAYGNRNTAVFNIAVFFKQSEPQEWRASVMDFNAKKVSPPLSSKEMTQVLNAVSKKDYFYKCAEEPCKSHCNRKLCRNRTYGLTDEQQMQNRVGEEIDFQGLIKINTDPPQWDLSTSIGTVRLTTDQLLNPQLTQRSIAEKFLKIIPPMKQMEWLPIVNSLMEKAEIVHAPDDASPTGLMFLSLREYLSTVSMMKIPVVDREKQWEAGLPVLVGENIWFKGSRFQEWLKRTRRNDVKAPSQIFLMLRDRGVEEGHIRIAGNIVRGWKISISKVHLEDVPELDMQEEF